MQDIAVLDEDLKLAAGIARTLHSYVSRSVLNRRRDLRAEYITHLTLVLLFDTDLPRVPAFSIDLSPHGLGMLCRRSFNPGDHFATLLCFGSGRGRFVLGRVAFCRYASACLYHMGCQFEDTAPKCTKWESLPEHWAQLAQEYSHRGHNSVPTRQPPATRM